MIDLPAPGMLRLVPLGGLGEIGMNCLALEQRDGILVVDCGSTFPFDDLGIDVFHPDFSWLLQRQEAVCGVFITHGHEDHIGGLPYLLRELAIPVWGPPHALALAQRRLAEHALSDRCAQLHEAHPGQSYRVGPFKVEPVRVTHSIIEATALRIDTDAGTVLHTGDFNFELDPPDGQPPDIERLQAIGDEGVELLLSDSTNVDVVDRPGSEREVGRALQALVEAAAGRVFVCLFASNIQRMLLLGELALCTGRKLCLMGRSLQTQATVARDLGYLSWPSDLVLSPEAAGSWPGDNLLVLIGGTQGERQSSLARLARGEHSLLRLRSTDTVVLSSRTIPGNERPVLEMLNALLQSGVVVHTRLSRPALHTSGHASQSEQIRMLELIRPRAFVPVHGTHHHMQRHAELARQVGVQQVQITRSGRPALLGPGGLRLEAPVESGRIAVGFGGMRLPQRLLQQRLRLGRSGVAIVSLALGPDARLMAGPAIHCLGVPGVGEGSRVLERLAGEVRRCVERKRRQPELLTEAVRRNVRRGLRELSGTKPSVEVQVLWAEES